MPSGAAGVAVVVGGVLSRGRWWTPIEVGAFAASLLVLVLVAVRLPGPPEYPTPADFRDAAFNPFAPLAKYRPPDCEATAVAWSSRNARACAADRDVVAAADTAADTAAAVSGAGTLELKCGLRRDGHGPVPSEQFYKPLKEAGRVHFLNFTGPVSGQAVSAVVVLPDVQYQAQPLPVVYGLHPRDQGYEKIDENGRALSTPAEHLVQGVHGWIASTICTFNDPRMEPHILVIPLRGGDRMWLDCKDPSACALETQVTQDLVPYIDSHYKTIASLEGRACVGYSMGAAGCLNLVLRHPDIFSSTVVQSPGNWPRFVSWEELIATEGAATSKFSTRDFLLDNVFDGKKGYESLTTCNIVSAALQSGKIQKHRPKIRVWFGLRDPYIAQDEALFNCFACNQMCFKYHGVAECAHSEFETCLPGTDQADVYLNELFTLFDH